MPCLSSLNSQFLFIRIICRKIRNEFAKALLLGVLANLNCPSITLAKKTERNRSRGEGKERRLLGISMQESSTICQLLFTACMLKSVSHQFLNLLTVFCLLL